LILVKGQEDKLTW